MPRTHLNTKRVLSDEQVYRVSPAAYLSIEHLLRAAEIAGLSNAEAIAYVKRQGFLLDLDSLVKYFFRPPPPVKFAAGRFNDASMPCIYVSLTRDVAGIEKAHHLLETSGAVWPHFLVVYNLTLTGLCWDLTSVNDSRLHSDDWTYTQEVGRIARSDSDAILAISARCIGVNAAVFNEMTIVVGDVVDTYQLNAVTSGATTPTELFNQRT